MAVTRRPRDELRAGQLGAPAERLIEGRAIDHDRLGGRRGVVEGMSGRRDEANRSTGD